MSYLTIALLAFIQGAAELLPISSSAHVIMTQKILGIDPAAPEMTFLLVMLHTGTMFAVLVTFWSRWKKYLSGGPLYQNQFLRLVVAATAVTGFLGLGLKKAIETVTGDEIEILFKNLPMMAFFLVVVGILILVSGYWSKNKTLKTPLTLKNSLLIGAIQGLCLPFRGFSRSGATISTALFCKIPQKLAEDFSFALAVAVTPPVIFLQVKRLLKAQDAGTLTYAGHFNEAVIQGMVGMAFSFISGMLALKLLSHLIEHGKWHRFGYYCFFAACLALIVHRSYG